MNAQRFESETTLREWLQREPFTLSLSAGFFGFYAHAGFVSVLEDEGLKPRLVTGCSAGSLVGGLWASGCSIATLKDFIYDLDWRDFWDPGVGLGVLKGQRFDAILKTLLGVENIEDTPTSLRITVFDLKRLATDYLDAGELSCAIRASCAFPGLFQPVVFNGRQYVDGGILDRSSMGAVAEGMPILYHHLTSRSKVRRHLKRLSGWQNRPNLVPLSVSGLPKVSPFHLHRGPKAYDIAREYFQRRLDAPAQATPL